ncbi:MAG: isoprenylcysteine carboxylmethyltransferase family protein [Methanospirillum sp.]|uniref:methyltransferase family protein n=1 Tax=Methanospirillum sp. TaxID=45200 RepID=UPI002372742A|nr:isoprenylcysteine carboxylmethyltransferase family protein [Methanospirillum sp.]MDD1727842.1 isoprenylcysteine carboxylmethyltransferase family protein [Methanospirillum sp.]
MNRQTDRCSIRDEEREIRIKGVIIGMIPVLIMAIVLFGSSGDGDWMIAWIFIGIHTCATIILSFSLDVTLITERSTQGADMKRWDQILVKLLTLSGLLILLVAGLDHRFHITPSIPFTVQTPGIVLFILGYGLLIWAAESNAFFSAVVRIQHDRGHHVISRGPYRFVRHPGYSGLILCMIAEPLMFQSLMAGIPCIMTIGLLVWRTWREDRTLSEELGGYDEYSGVVPFRLVPGVW